MRLRLLVVAIGTLLSVGVMAPAAHATDAQTYNLKDAVETFTDVVPCNEDLGLYDFTLTENIVIHETAKAIDLGNPDDPFDDILTPPFHITATFAGTFEAVPQDPSQPSFTGHFSSWFGVNSNQKNESDTATFTVVGKGSDGSTARFHVTAHFSVTPNGQVLEFEKPRCH
jgi:hypothetical protein